MVRRSVLLFIFLSFAAPLFFLGHHYMTLSFLKAQMSVLMSLQQEHTLFFMASFFSLYVAVAALSIPGAAIMTLAAGAIFGITRGTLLASFASSLGALFAFLVARYLLRDYVERRFSDRMRSIDQGLEREGAFYLLTLRLLPLFPFFLVNVLLGLTRMRSGIFYLVSQIGMLPGTLVYVNAGTQLAHLSNPKDILSLRVLGSFALLA
ncbi:MAG: TVP38/TMEM64 family protein, partial [Pseudomonadales bacterium]|nr:TVP38/TMEM64 family protein [Pseudomonadales bacterium]